MREMTSGSPPSAAECKEFHPLLSSQVAFAPFSRNHLTARGLPVTAANIRGVRPSADVESMFGTWAWMREMTSGSPPCAAQCKEFHPMFLSLVAAAPFSRNHFTARGLPVRAANISGVRPSADLESMFGTWVWMREMTSGSPPCAAKCKEFHLLLSSQVAFAPFSRNHFTARGLPFSAANISGV